MPDGLQAALALPGLPWLVALTFLAGAVYGFVGFGAALIFMPLATLIIPPALAVAALNVSAVVSLITLVPRAWPATDRRQVLTMVGAGFVTMPLGVWLLTVVDPVSLRLVISGVVAVTLAALMAGWRYRVAPGPAARLAVGGATGILGSATGLMGPIVILFNLGAGAPAGPTRANTLVFLTLISLLLLPQMAVQGAIGWPALWLGLLLLLPYGLGGLLGQALFRPEHEMLYRRAAYGTILAALIAGLPVWG